MFPPIVPLSATWPPSNLLEVLWSRSASLRGFKGLERPQGEHDHTAAAACASLSLPILGALVVLPNSKGASGARKLRDGPLKVQTVPPKDPLKGVFGGIWPCLTWFLPSKACEAATLGRCAV